MTMLRILLLEDDPMIGSLLTEMLEDMGHTVCAVEASVTGGVAAAARHLPDLVIADARLRDGSGVSAVADISRARPVPHVFMSGDIQKVRTLRPDATTLRKPFGEDELRRAIQRVLASGGSPPVPAKQSVA